MAVSGLVDTDGLRAEVRAWLEANWTGRAGATGPSDVAGDRSWMARMQTARWVAPHWPHAYGGRGASPAERKAIAEEWQAAGAPGAGNPIGTGWAGPTILAWGTDAQKERFLLPILTGAEIWCQLFSEPGAGSDLASLTTRADRDGDQWVVNGQKVWTSGARVSDWGILIARTDHTVPNHEGITFFLLDMRAPGIEIRPLRQMNGAADFNEVFLSDARVPDSCRVGNVNAGWRVAMTTLMNERVSLSGSKGLLWGAGPDFDAFLGLARATCAGADPIGRQELAQLYIEHRVWGFTKARTSAKLSAGSTPGPEAAIQKLFGDRLGQKVMASAMRVLGSEAMLWDGTPDRSWQASFLFSRALTIGGGTEEVQKNIIGERALGLPR